MESFLEEINERDNIIIYGAQGNAVEAMEIISFLYPDKLMGCAVTSMKNNPTELVGYPVKTIDDYDDLIQPERTAVLLAVRMSYIDEIKDSLLYRGYDCVLDYFADIRNKLLRQYFERKFLLI